MRQTGRMLGMDFYSPGLKAWKRGSLELDRLGLFFPGEVWAGGRTRGWVGGWVWERMEQSEARLFRPLTDLKAGKFGLERRWGSGAGISVLHPLSGV